MRASSIKINKTLKATLEKTFSQLLADLKNPNDVSTFLNDFLTKGEKNMLVKRLAVMYWLKKGRSYSNIKENLKVSSATISSCQKMMDSEGVQLAIKHLEAEEWANKWSGRFKKLRK